MLESLTNAFHTALLAFSVCAGVVIVAQVWFRAVKAQKWNYNGLIKEGGEAMTDKQTVLLRYPQATLFKSGNGLYMILSHVPMGVRIEHESNKRPADAWKAAAFEILVNDLNARK